MHSREISLPTADLPPPTPTHHTTPELVCTVVKSVFLLMTLPRQPPLPTQHTTPELLCTVVKSVFLLITFPASHLYYQQITKHQSWYAQSLSFSGIALGRLTQGLRCLAPCSCSCSCSIHLLLILILPPILLLLLLVLVLLLL
jgi:hypothetical protein